MLIKSLSILSLVPATLIALLILAVSSQANPITESSHLSSSRLINLNQTSSFLTQGNQEVNPFLHSLSCPCSICTGISVSNNILVQE
ncbi:MAG: hypothetical protein AB4058_19530 [Microcystaceae cyanobacterium]